MNKQSESECPAVTATAFMHEQRQAQNFQKDRRMNNANSENCRLQAKNLLQIYEENDEADPEGSDNGSQNKDEESESECLVDEDCSDDEDAFCLTTQPVENCSTHYQTSPLCRWHCATHELQASLRHQLTLPVDPRSSEADQVWNDVKKGVSLPRWHCCFSKCRECGIASEENSCYEHKWWSHIWQTPQHKRTLESLINKHKLLQSSEKPKDVAFTLLLQAIAEQERQTVPLVGLATDRRTLNHIGEVLKDDRIKTIMCFICSCKHVYHQGFDKLGEGQSKGTIDYRDNTGGHLDALLRGQRTAAYKEAWLYNLSFDRYKKSFGSAVAGNPLLEERNWEWKRKVSRDLLTTAEVLCNPEDVVCGSTCRHGDDMVCPQCKIPVCNECWQLSLRKLKIPKALANDNFIGYVHEFFAREKVNHIIDGDYDGC